MPKVLIIGASSAIAEEVCKLFATKDKAELFLVARNEAKLKAIADDMKVRGASAVYGYNLDLMEINQHQALLDRVFADAGTIDYAIIAHGSLSNEQKTRDSIEYAMQELNLNLNSFVSLSLILANKFEKQKSGSLTIISSVAGDRGRQKLSVYGTAKAGLSYLGQALAQRLIKSNVHVLIVRPGIVDTPMTVDLPKGILAVKADKAGKDIYNAIKARKVLIYTPWFWRYIMLIIRLLPQTIFLRTKF